MDQLITQGVIIGASPFKDYDCILSLFTPSDGLIKLYAKHAYKKGKEARPISPLTVVEVVYSKGRSELYPCQEITAVHHNLQLRQNLAVLHVACDMLQAIKSTQQPGKPAPELYQLLLTYLSRLPTADSPEAIRASFLLKLLRYEGLIGTLSHCSVCATMLNEAWVHEGEALCRQHKPVGAMYLTEDECGLAILLAFGRDFNQLASLAVTPELTAKIREIFEEQANK